jgi:hypothetical protein
MSLGRQFHLTLARALPGRLESLGWTDMKAPANPKDLPGEVFIDCQLWFHPQTGAILPTGTTKDYTRALKTDFSAEVCVKTGWRLEDGTGAGPLRLHDVNKPDLARAVKPFLVPNALINTSAVHWTTNTRFHFHHLPENHEMISRDLTGVLGREMRWIKVTLSGLILSTKDEFVLVEIGNEAVRDNMRALKVSPRSASPRP